MADKTGLTEILLNKRPLLEREKIFMDKYQYAGNSPQIASRRKLVDYILLLGSIHHVYNPVKCLAVLLYNFFQDSHGIAETQLHVLAVTCFGIAGKFYSQDPCYNKLIELLPDDVECCLQLKRSIETMVLKYFNWKIMIPTLSDYLENYRGHLLDIPDILCDSSPCRDTMHKYPGTTAVQLGTDLELLSEYLERYNKDAATSMDDIQMVIMKQEPTNKFRPSLIAASIVVLARLAHGFLVWNERIHIMLGYDLSAVVSCLNEYVLQISSEEIRKVVVVTNNTIAEDDLIRVVSVFRK